MASLGGFTKLDNVVREEKDKLRPETLFPKDSIALNQEEILTLVSHTIEPGRIPHAPEKELQIHCP